ncbi:MAG: ATP synthase F0 subunit C [Terriglobia bacterium]
MKTTKLFFLTIAMMFLAVPMFAQGTGAATTGGSNPWVPVTAGFSMAIASGLCALGQGKAIAGAAEGMARNPAASASIRFALILGLVLIESLALYTFAIIFVKVV